MKHSIFDAKSAAGNSMKSPYSITHSEAIRRLRADLSPFLVHLTRSGTVKLWADIIGQSKDEFLEIDAEESLKRIIRSSRIEAKSPFGYFNFKIPYRKMNGNLINASSRVQRSWLRSVCFTEAPVDTIGFQCQFHPARKCQFERFGLAFFESPVRRAGGNPIFYVDSQNAELRSSLDVIPASIVCEGFAPMMPFFECFGKPIFSGGGNVKEIDFRWEREWRIVGDFEFSKLDVAFGLCPEEHISGFESLVSRNFLFVDPFWSKERLVEKLSQDERLKKLLG
jgi:hypothetical protein